MITNISMHRIGKIKHCGFIRKLDNIPLRGNTNTSEGNKSVLVSSKNSMDVPEFCWMSSNDPSQLLAPAKFETLEASLL